MSYLKTAVAGALVLGLCIVATEAQAQGIRGAGSKSARNYFPQTFAGSQFRTYAAPVQVYRAPVVVTAPADQVAESDEYRAFAAEPGEAGETPVVVTPQPVYRTYQYQVAPGPMFRGTTPSYLRADSKARGFFGR